MVQNFWTKSSNMLCLHKSQEVNLTTYKLSLAEIAGVALTVVYFPTT